MAKLWFISAPLYSHTDWGGFLQTARTLQKQAHDVIWISEETLRGAIEAQGIPFEPVARTGWLWPPPPTPDLTAITPQEAVMLRYRRALDTWLSEDLVIEGIRDLIRLADSIGKPDAFVIDPFLSAAAFAAEALDVPLFVAGWPAQADLDEQSLFPVQRNLSSDSQQRIHNIRTAFGLEGIYFSKGTAPSIISPHLHITYFTPDWYGAEQNLLLPQTQYVGGIKRTPSDDPPQWLLDIPQDTPLALITLGTIFTGDLGFFSWAARAAASNGLLPIVVIGWQPIEPTKKAEFKQYLPNGTRLLAWAPFDHVLPRCQIMMHHGGMGTTHHAILHGVPQIVVPHAADQRIQARRVSEMRVGLNLTASDVQRGQLQVGTKALLEADWVTTNARQFADDMARLGGVERAAQLIAGTLARMVH